MATPRKKPEDKLKTGRRSTYDPDFHPEQAFRFSLLGSTDKQMAESWGISVVTLNAWKIKYPAFLKSLNDGKAPADSEVAATLRMRAKGFYQRVSKVMVINGKVKIVKYDEYFPPSDTAGIFWLKNRQRETWRDVQRNEHTGKDGDAIKTEVQSTVIIDASKLDPDAREALRAALKAAKG